MQTPIDIWLFQIYNLIFAEIFANWSIFLNVIYILMVENVCLQEIYWSQNQLSLCTLKKNAAVYHNDVMLWSTTAPTIQNTICTHLKDQNIY